jgi:hypothetical protein
MDDAISTVVAITGTTPEVARHFLSLTDGNAEQAIQLFFDSPDLSSSIAQGSSNAASSQQVSGEPLLSSGGRRDPINLDSDDEDVAMDVDSDSANHISRNQQQGYEDDEAIARRMQEELYGGNNMAGAHAEEVRAPLARTTETLVGPGADWASGDVHSAVLEQLRGRQQPRRGEFSSMNTIDF